MPAFDTDKPRRWTKAYGVLLAGLVATGSLVLVAVTQDPKNAVSSPGPAKAAIVPQIANAKSEAEILFRGKSFTVLHRAIRLPFSGEILDIHAREGQTVEKDTPLVTYRINREDMKRIHALLYPANVQNLRNGVYGQEIALYKLKNVALRVKELNLQSVKKQYEDVKQLESKKLAPPEAVKNRERQLEVAKKEIVDLKESMKQTEATLAKTKKDLKFQEENQKRELDLLEWQTKRSYAKDSKIPLDIGYLTSPIAGQVMWLHPELRIKAEPPRGFEAVRVAPMDSMVVRCKVHELDLVKLKPGDRGTAIFDAIPEKQYPCNVNRIPWVSRNPSLEVPADYEIECLLQNPDVRIKAGMTCNVKVSIKQ